LAVVIVKFDFFSLALDHLYRSIPLPPQTQIPVTYPTTPPELILPELDGKTFKMYHGGKICLDDHFKPLWKRNAPKFGIAHAFALGMGVWLAAEIPFLIEANTLTTTTKNVESKEEINDDNDNDNDDNDNDTDGTKI
jgi:hypothetical protein